MAFESSGAQITLEEGRRVGQEAQENFGLYF